MPRDLAHYQLSKRLAHSDLASVTEILAALHRLHSACQLGHFNRPDGSRGRTEFETAMQEARHVLQRTRKYGEGEAPYQSSPYQKG